MIPDDRDLPHVRGDECPRCHAFDGEPHGLRCADAASDDDTVAPATRLVAGRYVDGLACRLCNAFAPRHATLTHAAGCRERTAS